MFEGRLGPDVFIFQMESRCYADIMSSETSPEAALDAAAAARGAAVGAVRVPRWFPPLAGLSYGLGFVLLGVSALTLGSERAAFAIAGIVLCAINIASFAILIRQWLRAGVMPRASATTPMIPRRWVWLSTGGMIPLPIAVAGLVWLVTDRVGWAAITLGVLLGASTWWRLSIEARRTR